MNYGTRLCGQPLKLTPVYNRQLRLSRRKAHKFALKLTCLIRTQVYKGKGHFICVPSSPQSLTNR